MTAADGNKIAPGVYKTDTPEGVTMTFVLKGAAGNISGHNYDDKDGNPAGGWINGLGFKIDWQDGPLGREPDRINPNGAFVEDVVTAVLTRLRYYNDGKFRSRENSLAITKLEEALHWMNHRTAEREARGVEGTHQA